MGFALAGPWNVQFKSGGTNIDFGYSQWHSDGTQVAMFPLHGTSV
jgi:hypothetical protein